MGLKLVWIGAGLWGLLEATVFFIVPDVLLSAVALNRERAAYVKACAFTLLGALAGGAAMSLWAARAPEDALSLLAALPAIDRAMIEGVAKTLADDGLIGLFAGAVTGVPYKIFAVQAAQLSVPLPLFLLVSVPARLFRWILVYVLVRLVASLLEKRVSCKVLWIIWAAFWVLFYGFYFAALSG